MFWPLCWIKDFNIGYFSDQPLTRTKSDLILIDSVGIWTIPELIRCNFEVSLWCRECHELSAVQSPECRRHTCDSSSNDRQWVVPNLRYRRLNVCGPSTDPGRTLQSTLRGRDCWWLTGLHSVTDYFNHLMELPSTQNRSCSTRNLIEWSTVSKSALIFRRICTNAIMFPLSIVRTKSWGIAKPAVSVEWDEW